MSRRTTRLLQTALSALHHSGAGALLAPLARGRGGILMLHQVAPDPPHAFEPNRILRVTPEFLDRTIRGVLEAGYTVLAMDEVARTLGDGEPARPFVAFTLDDAYKDNLVHAYPVFKRYRIPFTVYVPTDYIDGHGELWWLALERAIRTLDQAELRIGGRLRRFDLATPARKDAAYHTIYWWLRGIDEVDARAMVAELCREAGIDQQTLCRDLVMNWDELHRLAADPLVTIGAHTRRHFAVARLMPAAARAELAESRARIERELGRPCRHLSFPFGDATSAGPRDFAIARELGFTTAVTTRKGLLHAGHGRRLHSLPRVSLNGDYQQPHYVKVLLDGAPFMFLAAAQRLGGRKAAA